MGICLSWLFYRVSGTILVHILADLRSCQLITSWKFALLLTKIVPWTVPLFCFLRMLQDEHDPSLQSSPVSWIFEAVPGDHMHKRRSTCFSLRIGMEATLLFKGIKAPVMLLSMQFCEVVNCPESSLITGTSSESYSYKSSMSVDCDSSYACSGDRGTSMIGSQLMVSYLDSEDGLPSIWSTGNASLALFWL